jgi:hypothetical protein
MISFDENNKTTTNKIDWCGVIIQSHTAATKNSDLENFFQLFLFMLRNGCR